MGVPIRAWGIFICSAVLAALTAGPGAEPASAKGPIRSLMVSKLARAPGGREESWSLDLYPNGRLAWRGLHTGELPEDCSPRAGHFEQTAPEARRETLLKLAERTSREKGLSAEEAAERFGTRYTVTYEDGGTVRTVTLRPAASGPLPELLREVEAARQWLFALPTSPAHALELDVSRRGKALVARIKNIGFVDTPLLLPEAAAEEAFSLRVNARSLPLKYAERPREQRVMLKAGESAEVALAAPAEGVAQGSRLTYDSTALLHHAEPGTPALKVSLCGGAK